MPKRKSPKEHRSKFRILLDSAFATPKSFPVLNKKTNLKHAVLDFGLSKQAEDEEIYLRAIKDNRFVLTINYGDFKKLVKKGKPGIIGVESQLSNEQIDKHVWKFLSRLNPDECLGKALRIPSIYTV